MLVFRARKLCKKTISMYKFRDNHIFLTKNRSFFVNQDIVLVLDVNIGVISTSAYILTNK